MMYSEQSVEDQHGAIVVAELPKMDRAVGVFAHVRDGEKVHIRVVEMRDGTRYAQIVHPHRPSTT